MDLDNIVWNEENYNLFVEQIKNLRKKEKMISQRKIIRNGKSVKIVKIPLLKEMAEKISLGNWEQFLLLKPKIKYAEETIVIGLVIGNIKNDYNRAEKYINYYMPLIDSPFIVDVFTSSLSIIKENRKKFFFIGKKWLKSDNPYLVRAGYAIFAKHFNTREYIDELKYMAVSVRTKDKNIIAAVASLIVSIYLFDKEKGYEFFLTDRELIDKEIFKKAAYTLSNSPSIPMEQKKSIKILAGINTKTSKDVSDDFGY